MPARPAPGAAAPLISGPTARSPTPPTGGPLHASSGPDRPHGDEISPRIRYLGRGTGRNPTGPLPTETWRPSPEGPLLLTPRFPGDPDNALLTLRGTRVWGTQISCTCSLPSDTPTGTHITPFPAPNTPLFTFFYFFTFVFQNHTTHFEASVKYPVLENPSKLHL